MDDMEMMENDNIIVLTDEDGVDVEFEFCASVEYEGNEYVVLLPTEDDDGEVVILQVMEDEDAGEDDGALIILREVQNEDGSFYEVIEDDDEFAEVGEEFESRLDEIFDFED